MGDPRLSAEGELALARLALDGGDLTHAADHLSDAIAHAPTMPEVHEVLAQLAARTGGGLELFPLDRHPFIGTVVARAHLLAAAGQPAAGLELLAAATGHAPVANWAGVPWVGAPELPGRLDPERLARILMQICARIPDPVPETDRGPLRPYLRLAGHAVDAHPHSGLLHGAASALARRVGEVDIAISWARRGVDHWPSKLSEVWLGYAYRSAGRTAEALAALRRAVAHDPDDLSVYADIAGTLADHGRLDEALGWIDRALARDASFDCAVHTGHRLRYRRDGALIHLVALADFQRDHPDDSHEHSDLAECCHGQPWLSQIPAAGEAVVGVLRHRLSTAGPTTAQPTTTQPATTQPATTQPATTQPATTQPATTQPATAQRATTTGPAGDGRLRLTGLEPPSAIRAVSAVLPDLTVSVAEIAEPDIREPRRASARRLWRYAGTVATPALPPPSGSAVDRIRQLAHPAWAHPPAVYDAAVGLATLEVEDLLGLLVHPPAAPDTALGRALTEHDPTLWVRTVQVWACLGLLHHRTDEPWPDSTRRRVLLDLVWGVEDWITEAALFALVTIAWVDPPTRPDVAEIVAERLADGIEVARRRPVSIARSLAQLALATPTVDPATAATAREVLNATDQPAAGPGWLRRLRRWLTGRR